MPTTFSHLWQYKSSTIAEGPRAWSVGNCCTAQLYEKSQVKRLTHGE